MGRHDRTDQGKAQTDQVAPLVQRAEGLKDARQGLCGNAPARVLHPQKSGWHPLPLLDQHPHLNAPLLRLALRRVGQQLNKCVLHHLHPKLTEKGLALQIYGQPGLHGPAKRTLRQAQQIVRKDRLIFRLQKDGLQLSRKLGELLHGTTEPAQIVVDRALGKIFNLEFKKRQSALRTGYDIVQIVANAAGKKDIGLQISFEHVGNGTHNHSRQDV